MNNYQNNIENLSKLENSQLENIFTIYQDSKTYYFYNLLNNISFPDELDNDLYYWTNVNFDMPLTTISYKYYGDIKLWWLILIVNKIQNPFLKGVKTVKIIKPKHVQNILNMIYEQL